MNRKITKSFKMIPLAKNILKIIISKAYGNIILVLENH